jgi:hypothetical protein
LARSCSLYHDCNHCITEVCELSRAAFTLSAVLGKMSLFSTVETPPGPVPRIIPIVLSAAVSPTIASNTVAMRELDFKLFILEGMFVHAK